MKEGGNKSNLGVYIALTTGGIALVSTIVTIPFLTPGFRKICLPFVPATKVQISNILKALEGRSGLLVDLGSGDGRVVLSAARAGFQAVGVELNIWLVLYSKLTSLVKKCNSAKFVRSDLWKFNLNSYSNVVVFGTEHMMKPLEDKLLKELPDNSVVVTSRYPLPSIEPEVIIGTGIDTVWKYRFR